MLRRRARSNVFLVLSFYLIYVKVRDLSHRRRLSLGDSLPPPPSHAINALSSAAGEESRLERVDPVTLVQNYKKIEERFLNRKSHLRNVCQTPKRPVDPELRAKLLPNIIADSELPSADQTNFTAFFGCIPPESGSTIFHAWWWDIYQPDREFNAHARRENAAKIEAMAFEQLADLAQSAKSVKFLVVRHPLTRFVSNWDDHFCFGCETGRAIVADNPDITAFVKTSLDEDYQIGFKELVQFVNQYGIDFDVHFSTQRNECRPCAIDYDYIIKLESIHEDIQYIMAKLNRPDNTKELVSHEAIAKNKNAKLYRNYFNLVAGGELERLVALYQDDLDLFNYTFDFKTKSIGGWD